MKRYVAYMTLCALVIIFGVVYTLPFASSSALCKALRNGDSQTIKEEMGSLQNVNQYSMPVSLRWFANILGADIDLPLIVACNQGDSEAVEHLLKKGADPNLFLDGNWSAIEAAFTEENPTRLKIAQMLVECGADVNLHGSRTSALFLELQHYIYKGEMTDDEYDIFESCVILLLENGADPVDNLGNTYVHYLARNDNAILTEKLIKEYPVDINCQNSKGMTALMWAASHGSEDTVNLLLNLGADVSIIDKDGKSAYDHALENGHECIAQRLINFK